jgi:hypothetical protein
VGYQVEYIIDLSPARAREWMSALPGWWADPESPGQLAYGEFEWGGQFLHVDLGAVACSVRVPRINYSWLVCGHAPSVEWVDRFEEWLSASLPGARAVRLDELVREQWEAWAGRSWEELSDPVESLRGWLPSHEYGPDCFRFLIAEQARPDHPLPRTGGA